MDEEITVYLGVDTKNPDQVRKTYEVLARVAAGLTLEGFDCRIYTVMQSEVEEDVESP